MPTIRITTLINAPRERVFDLARSIDADTVSASRSGERAIEGRTTGLIERGETVTWQARHLGVRQRLKVRITDFERPHRFADEMVSGAFKEMRHEHLFEMVDDQQTRMIDELRFQAPMGPLGRLAERFFLTRYMHRFLIERNRVLKELAESDHWARYLDPDRQVSPISSPDIDFG